MSQVEMIVPQYVVDDWITALKTREPRAFELARALSLSLPKQPETTAIIESTRAEEDATVFELSDAVSAMLDDAHGKYEALTHGDFVRVDLGNPNVVAFERNTVEERLLIVNNLARVSQPVKFKDYAGVAGWDILNRVEFIFPPRAQLESYEFLWLMIE